MKKTTIIYIVFISLLLVLLFNFPFLEIANKQEYVAGIPLIVFYLFAVWLLAIILLYFASKKLFNASNDHE